MTGLTLDTGILREENMMNTTICTAAGMNVVANGPEDVVNPGTRRHFNIAVLNNNPWL
jgi:hypothetical protein